MNNMLTKDTIVADLTKDLPEIAKEWLFKSQTKEAQEWRARLKRMAVIELTEARKRQALIQEQLKTEENSKKGLVRRVAVIDPVIAQDMRNRYGPGCWHDPDFIKDTKKKAPELFVPD